MVTKVNNRMIDGAAVNVLDFGAVGDGVTDDTAAFNAALSSDNSVILIPQGRFIVSDTLVIPRGKHLQGVGTDYWDTWTPADDRPTEPLLKRDDEGTHILFKGTGTKTYSAMNLAANVQNKVVDAVTHNVLDFTLSDSVGGAPATARPFSVGVVLLENSSIKDLRLVPWFNGIEGYNDSGTTALGDEWDVGIWADGAYESVIENVQCVGYWRMAGSLITENDGTYTQWGNNPERLRIVNSVFQGVRGCSIRNGAQWAVSSNTNTEITCEYNSQWTLTAHNEFRILGNAQRYTYTGYSVSGDKITLTGVSPNLPAGVSALRSPSQGNNFSGTILENTVLTSFEHRSGNSSDTLGLPVAGALEMNGFPLRGVKFVNTKMQTTYDKLNTIFGDCRDTKFVACQFENGAMIAYDATDSSVSQTLNLRFTNTYANSGTLNREAFTPRGYFNDYDAFPTEFVRTPQVFEIIPPMNVTKGSVQEMKLQARSSDDKLRLEYGDDGSDYTIRTGNNLSIQNRDGKALLNVFGSSKNMTMYGNLSPAAAGQSLGTSSYQWTVHGSKFITNGNRGQSGSFTTEDGKTVIVENGLIVRIA